MRRRLPPLSALRALEAAGRHVSFTKAADELLVTPGAISRRIKLLEDLLGLELFERTNRDLRISDDVRSYIGELTGIFDRIEQATKRLVEARGERPLRIHSAMTFTIRWLVPRLPDFHRLFPRREIQLLTSLVPLRNDRLNMGEVDVVIQPGRGVWPGLTAHRLAGSELIPVCSPALAREMGPAPDPRILSRMTLLYSMVKPNDWREWFEAAGAENVESTNRVQFETSNLAYQAALLGMGVAIGKMALVIDDLDAGRLVAPFDLAYDNGDAYYLTYAARSEQDPRLIEFRDWILSQAAAFRSAHRSWQSIAVVPPTAAARAFVDANQ